MRERFTEVVSRALDEEPRLAVVLADIGVARFEETGAVARHPGRVVNVGIREQLLISVAAGLALEGMRPVVHSYTPFLVERPFEQIKLDLGHQDVGAVLVSIGASYDAAEEGRTHQSPEDVSLLASLPGWTIHVPGHADEVEVLLRRAIDGDDRVYIRLSEETNSTPHGDGSLRVVRDAGAGAPTVLAVGPTLDPVLAATADLEVTVAYTATVRPLDATALRAATAGDGRRARRADARRHVHRGGRRRSARSPAPAARARGRQTWSCAATAPAPSTALRTVSTRRASAARSTLSCGRPLRGDP